MLHIEQFCPICEYGSMGFLRCSDNETIVLLCDECDAIWLSPKKVSANQALFPTSPEFLVPSLQCSIKEPPSRWATQEEVANKGWSSFIAGESKALGEV
jgi:hypothetical protein